MFARQYFLPDEDSISNAPGSSALAGLPDAPTGEPKDADQPEFKQAKRDDEPKTWVHNIK